MITQIQSSGQNFMALNHYMSLPQPKHKTQVEYIWIGGNNELRGKSRTYTTPIHSVKDVLPWNFDGSSTKQACGNNSEVYLKPVKIVRDPFRRGDNLLCLCETFHAESMKPLDTNQRHGALKIFEHKSVVEEEPWYGIEQEYTLFNKNGTVPLGFPAYGGFPAPQGQYYCSVGSNNTFGRAIAEAHYRACLYAGLDISGINAEVMPGQWEFQVGPCLGVDSADQLWLARYILQRVSEDFNAVVSYKPKPVKGDWNGAGAHTNYSTKSMRKDGGYDIILKAIKKLEKYHDEHMNVYGANNKQRLTGYHETASWTTFTSGVADRSASIRIPRQTQLSKKGYFEDRRPAANCCPYQVTSVIAQTTILSGEKHILTNNSPFEDVEKKKIQAVKKIQDETQVSMD